MQTNFKKMHIAPSEIALNKLYKATHKFKDYTWF